MEDACYVQDKKTGDIREADISDTERKDPAWNMRNRRVRLLHHPESSCLFCEDYYTPSWNSSLQDGMVDELSIDEYRTLKALYENPDL